MRPFPISRWQWLCQGWMEGSAAREEDRQQTSPASGLPPKSWPDALCIPLTPSASQDTLAAPHGSRTQPGRGSPRDRRASPWSRLSGRDSQYRQASPSWEAVPFLPPGRPRVGQPHLGPGGALRNWVGPASLTPPVCLRTWPCFLRSGPNLSHCCLEPAASSGQDMQEESQGGSQSPEPPPEREGQSILPDWRETAPPPSCDVHRHLHIPPLLTSLERQMWKPLTS